MPVFDACRAIVMAVGSSQELLHDPSQHANETRWRQVNDEMSLSLRQFEAAVREEFGVGGVDRSWILAHERPPGPEPDQA